MTRCAVPGCDCITAGVGGLCRRHYQLLPVDLRTALWRAHRAFRDAAPQNQAHQGHVYDALAKKAAQSLAPEVQHA